MVTSVTEYLDRSAQKYPDKVAFVDEKRSATFREVQEEGYHIAAALIRKGYSRQPVAVYLEKSVACINAFMGVLYSGNFYSPLDVKMPMERIEKITGTLEPVAVITDREHAASACQIFSEQDICIYEDMMEEDCPDGLVRGICEKLIDTDIVYVLFTSGSTGMPKGVIISEKSVIDFIEWGGRTFDLDQTCVLANQTPFYFSMSVFDIYQTLRNGGTMYIVPQKMFAFPGMLMQYLYQNSVNTIFWVPSALMLVSALRALRSPYLPKLRNVFFGGEVMPVKQLNEWRGAYPDVRYVNFYGPTEVTDTCTYYEVNREFSPTETLPMGHACRNMDVFLLDDAERLVPSGAADTIGEVCVRGTGLAYGYYRAPEKTREAFVQNPLQSAWPEIIYRTGDLAKYNEYGELVYVSRKDFQIKHKGHRIELGEIEVAAGAVSGVEMACCIYDAQKSRILLYYSGSADDAILQEELKAALPDYMLPARRIHLDRMPINVNGKIDRLKLKEMASA